MADVVGLEADLVLTIDRALSEIDKLEAALSVATTNVPVTVDVAAVAPAIDEAITAAATTPVVIEADPAGIPTTIEDAVAAIVPPPLDVPVEANTTDAKAELDALPGEVPSIDIPVEADTTNASASIADLGSTASTTNDSVGGLSGSVSGLGAAVGIADGSARELVGTLGEMGGTSGTVAAGGILALTGATAGFFEAGLTAVSAGQRFDLVLGDMGNKIKQIDVNGLNTSVEDLGIKFGSTAAEMENVNSKLFQNAINAGISKDKAVEFAQQIETLAARAISLNPQLGTLGDVSSNLGDKLARGGRFAANYGIQLSAAEISTRALQDTGKKTATELTIVEKSMAGAELASEKYGATLAGTVAEGSKNAAVQAEELKARFKEAIEQIGVPLVSPVLDLIRSATPDAVLVAKELGHLAVDIMPVLSAALTVVSVPLQIVGFVLDQIPGPVITAGAAFLGLGFALQAVAAAGLELDAIFPELLAASAVIAVIAGIGSAFQDSAPFADDLTRAVDTASKGFDDLTVSVHDTIAAEVDAAVKSGDFAGRLNDAHISADQLTQSLLDGGDAFNNYAQQILATAVANGASFDTFNKLSDELTHLKDQTEEAAHSSLDKAVADGKLTKADEDAAVAAAGQIDGQTNYAKALDTVQPKIKAAQDATDAKTKADKDASDAAAAHAASMKLIADQSPAVALNLANVTQTTGDWGTALAGLSLSLTDANLKSKDFDAVAASLGVTSEQLKGFIGDVSKEVQGFVDTALKGLPTVATAIDAVLNPPAKPPKAIIIDPAQLQAEIDADIAKIDAFNLQLAFLTQNGLNNLAQVAAQRGPEFTSALVTSIQNGGADVGTALDSKFGELNQKTRDEGPLLTEAGKGIAVATGDVARDASKSFGDHFDLSGSTKAQTDASSSEIDGWAHALPPKVGAAAQDAGDKFEQGFGRITASTDTTLTATTDVVAGHAVPLGTTSTAAGTAAQTGFASGVAPIVDAADKTLGLVEGVFTAAGIPLSIAARLSGELVGRDFDAGIAQGINDFIPSITLAVDNAITAAHDEARAKAKSQSPSLLFAEIGRDLAAGLALGIDDGSAQVAAAAGRLTQVAVPALPSARMSPVATSASVVPPSAQPPLIGQLIIPASAPNATAAAVLQRIAAARRLQTAIT